MLLIASSGIGGQECRPFLLLITVCFRLSDNQIQVLGLHVACGDHVSDRVGGRWEIIINSLLTDSLF